MSGLSEGKDREGTFGEVDIEVHAYNAKEFGMQPGSNAKHSLGILP